MFKIEDDIEIPFIKRQSKYSVVDGRKRCNKCNKIKNIEDFYFRKDNNNYRSDCKECNNICSHRYHENNREKSIIKSKEYHEANKKEVNIRRRKRYEVNREESILTSKKYYDENKEEVNIRRRKRYENNKEELKLKDRKYYNENKEVIKPRKKKYREENKDKIKGYAQSGKGKEARRRFDRKFLSTPKGKISSNISRAIRFSLKGNKHGHHWEKLVNYTLKELMSHLESQFESWMNWDNYGRSKNGEITWSIDHIKPISSFDFDSYEDEEFLVCWSLKNLRPLDFIENIQKRDKIA